MELPNCDKEFLVRQTKLILSSYKHWTGKDLCSPSGDDAGLVNGLFFAPRVVLSSGTEEDPVLNYGNQAGLELWEMDWETLTKTPGRHTAETMEREKREQFLVSFL